MNAFVGNSGVVAAALSLPPPENSLDFDGASDHLTMSNADWGPYDRTQFSIIFSVYFNTLAAFSTVTLFAKGDGSGGEIRVDYDVGNNEIEIRTRDTSNTFKTDAVSVTLNTGQFYHFKLDFNGNLATATDRMSLSLDGALQTFEDGTAWSAELQTGTEIASIGARNTASNKVDALIHQFTFVSGNNPATADVYADGAPKNTANLSGLWSRLGAEVDAVTDDVRPNWTNNGSVGVTVSAP